MKDYLNLSQEFLYNDRSNPGCSPYPPSTVRLLENIQKDVPEMILSEDRHKELWQCCQVREESSCEHPQDPTKTESKIP